MVGDRADPHLLAAHYAYGQLQNLEQLAHTFDFDVRLVPEDFVPVMAALSGYTRYVLGGSS